MATHYAEGSIPACAGEPRSRRQPRRISRVYPRVCGGTMEESRILQEYDGLSPRVRGNLQAYCRPLGIAGSIPACAGEPATLDVWLPRYAVYPRVCGGTEIARAVGRAT